jgi:hypothetical protein
MSGVFDWTNRYMISSLLEALMKPGLVHLYASKSGLHFLTPFTSSDPMIF